MRQTLLERIAAGDPEAVQECIDRYGALVCSLARRHLRQHADAEDAVQEVFIEIWRDAGRFDPAMASEATFNGDMVELPASYTSVFGQSGVAGISRIG